MLRTQRAVVLFCRAERKLSSASFVQDIQTILCTEFHSRFEEERHIFDTAADTDTVTDLVNVDHEGNRR